MKIKPVLVAAAATVAVGGATLLGGSMVHAQSASNGDGIIDKIATRFNLNRDEVKQVFDEVHQEHEAEMKTKMSEYLQSKVDDGTITADQKAAIEAKQAEMQTKREALRDQDLTPEQRRDAMKTMMDEMKTWAEQQGIDISTLMPQGGPGRGHHGMGMGHGEMAPDDVNEAPTPDDAQ